MPVRLIILGDVRLSREGPAAKIASSMEKVQVVARCRDPDEALRAIARFSSAVVLADAGTAAGLGGVRRIGRESPHTRVVALGREDESYLDTAPGDHLDGFLGPDASLDELIAAVEMVSREGAAGQRMGDGRAPGASGSQETIREVSEREPPLTSRELEVMELLELGLSNKQIARRLSIRLATVKNHVHSILSKLKVGNRQEAVAAMRSDAAAESEAKEGDWSWREAVGATPEERARWRAPGGAGDGAR